MPVEKTANSAHFAGVPIENTANSAHFAWVQQQTHPKVNEKKWATGQNCIRKRSTTLGTINQ